MNEPSLHDWQYENASKSAFDREVAREAEIKDAVQDRIGDLMLASGHGKDEQALIENVMSTLAASHTAYGTVKRYLFEIWKLRDAQTADEKRKRDRAAQVIANLIAPVLRDTVESEVSNEFVEPSQQQNQIDYKRQFIQRSRAWYEKSLPRTDVIEEITIGLYHKHGGTAGEFSIRWIELCGDKTPFLQAFDSSWRAMLMFRDVFEAMATMDGCNATPHDICEILIANGVEDNTPEKSPYCDSKNEEG